MGQAARAIACVGTGLPDQRRARLRFRAGIAFAAAVASLAVASGCGDGSVEELPSPIPIITAPARTTSKVLATEVATLKETPERFNTVAAAPAPSTTMAAEVGSSTVELSPVKRVAEGSNPSLPATFGVEQWRELVASIFPAYAVETVLRIMWCESEGNPNATGAAGERGLMQVHPIHRDSTHDPTGNLMAAYRISGGGVSWGAWTCKW